ncbi:Xaa-Pro dipeptidase [Idiomarina xiamenensis]|uniref:Proline dipeptidase n=1 Tax=Idiomarina xiamenensis 10-D-4 TaxID=740709 RepID=K2JIX5_9GAMM|nr:Xaa-Pro dipeptidase [Idiomarina xiamenensis]EKE83376.1 proline dipeptidase [Idiomarina xiamenensis 10-D-4]
MTPAWLELATLYQDHIQLLQQRYQQALARESLTTLAIHAGQLKRHFFDDRVYPFKANPYFCQWLPLPQQPQSWLVLREQQAPLLVIHATPTEKLLLQPLLRQLQGLGWLIDYINTPEAIERFLPYHKQQAAYLGEHIDVAKALGFEHINPESLINFLNYRRVIKSDYELACIGNAARRALAGQELAAQAFTGGASEFTCWLAYLRGSGLRESELPYAVQLQQRQSAGQRLMLIDGGADFAGYAAAITRTYCTRDDDAADLMVALEQVTLALVGHLTPGTAYADIESLAQQQLANLLCAFGLIKLAPEDIVEQRLTQYFMPYESACLVGLQARDVGAYLADERGTPIPPPAHLPQLKTTLTVAPRQVFRIGMGVYFIDSLLQRLAESRHRRQIDWQRVEQFRLLGTIRVEDNVVVRANHSDNLSRVAG